MGARLVCACLSFTEKTGGASCGLAGKRLDINVSNTRNGCQQTQITL
jgi:hypothetical protein